MMGVRMMTMSTKLALAKGCYWSEYIYDSRDCNIRRRILGWAKSSLSRHCLA